MSMNVLKTTCCCFTWGFVLLNSSHSRLCSRTKRVWNAIKPGCSLALESPATNSRLATRPTGLSLGSASSFSCLQNTFKQVLVAWAEKSFWLWSRSLEFLVSSLWNYEWNIKDFQQTLINCGRFPFRKKTPKFRWEQKWNFRLVKSCSIWS